MVVQTPCKRPCAGSIPVEGSTPSQHDGLCSGFLNRRVRVRLPPRVPCPRKHLVRLLACHASEGSSILLVGAKGLSDGHAAVSKSVCREFDSLQARQGAVVQREDTTFAMSRSGFDSRSLHGVIVQRENSCLAGN
jgi:hypothetical protein